MYLFLRSADWIPLAVRRLAPFHVLWPRRATSLEPDDPRLRENNFDLLRLTFAAMVVVFHVGALSETPWVWRLASRMPAHFAVKCFFFVSGFLVTMSFERSSSLRDYWAKRLRRIAPAYAFVVVSAAVGMAAFSRLPAGDYFLSREWWRYLASNLVFLNFLQPALPGVFVDHAIQEINGSLWTIKIEVAFYAGVPVLMWLARSMGRASIFQLTLALSLAWRIGLLAWSQRTGNPLFAKLAIQLPGQLCFFATGAIAYDRTRQGLSAPPLWAAIAGVGGYALGDGVLHEALSPVCVALFCYWAAIGAPKIALNVNRHGDISYGLYIYHWPLAQIVMAVGLFHRSPMLGLLMAFGGTVTLSYLSWHWIERPFLKSRFRSPTTVPAAQLVKFATASASRA